MILRKYGLELHSLKVDDLELVRSWRNDEFVQKRMLFQEEISRSDQKSWFDKLDETMAYLTIVYDQKKIGLINVRNINWKERSGEAGIIMGDVDYRNSFIPMLAVFNLMDTFFGDFGFETLIARVRRDNKKALDFNLDLGYTIEEEHEDYYLLSVNPTDYRSRKEKLNEVLSKFDTQTASHSFSDSESYLFLRK